jgi:hypothetical protein
LTSRLDNPREQALLSRTARPIADKRALRDLVARYGADTTLGQALATAQGVIDESNIEYRRMKARGEVL